MNPVLKCDPARYVECAQMASAAAGQGQKRDRREQTRASDFKSGAVSTPAPATLPSGDTGPQTGRDRAGRFAKGNACALVAGERSVAFWAALASVRAKIEASVIRDQGHTPDDAPAALRFAADSIAQARLIQLSAFERMKAGGGPLSSADRPRRSFLVWQAATDRLERHLRLVGLRRVPKEPESLASYLERAYGVSPSPTAPVAAGEAIDVGAIDHAEFGRATGPHRRP
jgi:hypothetical protein